MLKLTQKLSLILLTLSVVCQAGWCQTDGTADIDRETILRRFQRTAAFFETAPTETHVRWVSKHIAPKDFPAALTSLAGARQNQNATFWVDIDQRFVQAAGFRYFAAETFDHSELKGFDSGRTSESVGTTKAIWNGEYGKVLDIGELNRSSARVLPTAPPEMTFSCSPAVFYTYPRRLGSFPEWEYILGSEHASFEKREASADGRVQYRVSLDKVEVDGEVVPGARVEIWLRDDGELVTLGRGEYSVPSQRRSVFRFSDFRTLESAGTKYEYPTRIEVEYLTLNLKIYVHEVNYIDSLELRPDADISDYDFAFPDGTVVTDSVADLNYVVGAKDRNYPNEFVPRQ